MNINLAAEIKRQFDRCSALADEAEADDEESYSSRASALKALTDILRDLTKMQEEIINMERLMSVEATTIEVLRDFLTIEQQEAFMVSLTERLQR